MKSFSRLGTAVLTLAMLFAASALAQSRNEPQNVHLTGCVEAGVESGCLVLTDQATGKLYNLYFQNEKPAVGTAIELNGLTRPGSFTVCMQGLPVRVDNWKPISGVKCSGGDDGKKAKITKF
jgi:hypothetical protein